MSILEIKISGRFSRVGISFLVMQAAYKYNIHGFIHKENPDSFKIVAQSTNEGLDNFTDYIKSGYIGSRIKSIEITSLEDSHGFQSFDII